MQWNATHPNVPLAYSSDECVWQVTAIPTGAALVSNLALYWSTVSNKWVVRCHAYTATYLDWEGPTDPCDPTGSYGSHTDCNDGSGECGSVVATTCVVS